MEHNIAPQQLFVTPPGSPHGSSSEWGSVDDLDEEGVDEPTEPGKVYYVGVDRHAVRIEDFSDPRALPLLEVDLRISEVARLFLNNPENAALSYTLEARDCQWFYVRKSTRPSTSDSSSPARPPVGRGTI